MLAALDRELGRALGILDLGLIFTISHSLLCCTSPHPRRVPCSTWCPWQPPLAATLNNHPYQPPLPTTPPAPCAMLYFHLLPMLVEC